MTPNLAQVEEIFTGAVAKADPAQRAAYLDEACAENPELRQRLEDLLAADADSATFLPLPNDGTTATFTPLSERPGTVIGPYKLLQQIGEGGFGIVFMAEQSEPVKRTVALKIIKPGMDTRQVIARFEAERQALALMDHPNIARVLDAGTTGGEPGGISPGRPYFVMDLVKGIPIIQYCDQHQLTVEDRLGLFSQVCHAVQHAHQKGIIHRDLKPSNVLVAEYDNHAVPKVIDFGVAKATGQKLTEKTLFTEFGQLVGTFEYMSPEQAKLNQLDVDTRSDIYSLGVLLYELLAGSTPLEKERVRSAGFNEILRLICEEEPPLPSTRLSSSRTLVSISAQRHAEPDKLKKLVRGELDWIVMKCLEKERSRRYETAASLARDIERYLNDEPVQACPPSASYRIRKMVRRYRGLISSAAIVFVALVCGTAFSTWQALRATRAEQLAIAERDAKEIVRREAVASERQAKAVSDFLVDAFRSPSPKRDGRNITIAEVLQRAANEAEEKFADDPLTRGTLLHAIGESCRGLALFNEAITLLEKAQTLRIGTLGREHPDTIRCVRDLAWAYIVDEKPNEAMPLFEENYLLTKAKLGTDDPVTLQCEYDLAYCYLELGRSEDSLRLIEDTFARQEATLGREHADTVGSMFELAHNYDVAVRPDEAIRKYQEVIRLAATQRDRAIRLMEMEAKEGLALVYAKLERFDEAQPLIEESVDLYEKWLGPDHRGTRKAKENFGSISAAHVSALCNAENFQKRNPRRGLELALKVLKVDPKPQRAMLILGWAEYRVGHWQNCIDALTKSCEQSGDGIGNAFEWYFLAMAHWQLGHQDEARKWYDDAAEWMDKNEPNNEELVRFRTEAAKLLGINRTVPSPISPPDSKP